MNKTLLILVALVNIAAWAGAQQAVLQNVIGRVEYQLPGEDWQAGHEGDTLPAGALVATGFRGSVQLSIDGTVVALRPLTRLGVVELGGPAEPLRLSLLSGQIQADLSSVPGALVEVEGVLARVMAQGASFETDGTKLVVNRGQVTFSNSFGMARSVTAGEYALAGTGPIVASPVAAASTAQEGTALGRITSDAVEQALGGGTADVVVEVQ
jgi:hypothetical protein